MGSEADEPERAEPCMVMASCAGGLPDTLHHPLPDSASSHARHSGTPHFARKSAIGLARLHCFSRTQRSLRRSQSSRSLSAPLQAAWRKYVTQPVLKLFTSSDHPLERDPPIAPGDASKPLLGPVETFRRNAEPSAGQETMAEEVTLPHGSHRALLPVDPEAEPAFQEGCDRRQHPLARRLRPHVDVAVVGIAAEAVAPPFQFLVQVVQQQVRQAAATAVRLAASLRAARRTRRLASAPLPGSGE